MQAVALAGQASAAIDLNQPGSYLNWNFFTISVANLVLIAVMVAIFGAALLLPFPGPAEVRRPPRRGRGRSRLPTRMSCRETSGCGRRASAAGP
jgi:hypothetical protein